MSEKQNRRGLFACPTYDSKFHTISVLCIYSSTVTANDHSPFAKNFLADIEQPFKWKFCTKQKQNKNKERIEQT